MADDLVNESKANSMQNNYDITRSPMTTTPRILPRLGQKRPKTIGPVTRRMRNERKCHFDSETLPLKHNSRRSNSFDNIYEARIHRANGTYQNQQLAADKFTSLNDVNRSQTSLNDANRSQTSLKSCVSTDNISQANYTEVEKNSISICIMYGMINTAIVLPVIMSFGSIIYHDPFYRPYLPILVKLTTISGFVHQVCFSSMSSLPFAVGQVQDAGLIFLSAIASKIVVYCKQRDYDDESILATATVGLSLFTALLGVGLVIIGNCNLASYVQKLPTSVVGGYLAFIGFFCGQAGLCLMSSVEVKGVLQWYKFTQGNAFILLLPGLVGGISIYLAIRKTGNVAVLPCSIVAMVFLFYSALNLTGMSVEEARMEGWINDAETPPVWYHTWDFLRFEKVVWSALPPNLITGLSMTFVVALSSSLDVAAIELDSCSPLDYNHELKTVGYSNIISGLTGGYTGSYIFSQTIFSMRAGIRSRLCGITIALFELVTVVLPVSILAYLPNFFFGSLLIMICVDLMWEWLWDVRKKVTGAEYMVALGTFILIQVLGVEYGILAGVLLYMLCLKVGLDMGDYPDMDDQDKDNLTITPVSSYDGLSQVHLKPPLCETEIEPSC